MFIHFSHISNDGLAFKKKIPTVFVLDTPFQLLCAMEFMAEFEVDDYLIVAAFTKGEKRNEQVLQMLKDKQFQYVIVYSDNVVENFQRGLRIDYNEIGKKYERVVIGYYYAYDQWILSYSFAADAAHIVYGDDGTASVGILNGNLVVGRPSTWRERYAWKKNCYYPTVKFQNQIRLWWKEKHITDTMNMFTLYADIHSKHFVTYPNHLSALSKRLHPIDSQSKVFIIGTNSEAYRMAMGLSLFQYEGLVWQKLSEVRKAFPTADIIYVPHGRDTNVSIPFFCEKLGIAYKRLEYAVEYSFMKENRKAQAIFGFGSTALFTLKTLMPEALVVNWLIDNRQAESYDSYLRTARYYDSHGIKIDIIPFPNLSWIKIFKRNIKAVFTLLHLYHV